MRRPIYDTIMEYSEHAGYPWHMPGHKRQLQTAADLCGTEAAQEAVWQQLCRLDFTEIPGLDEYHSPEGIIRQAQEQAAEFYGVKNSYYLVNGSTVGILASMTAACPRGSRVLVGRNCHCSVYHGIELLDLQADYVYPKWLSEWDFYGGVSVEAVRVHLQKHPDTRAVILTSPTYEGVVSDIEGIANVVHAYGAVLIVDEAHGAHLKWMPGLPASAVDCGADLVIESLHKTLPALTQTAVLHRCSDRILEQDVFHYVSLYQSTSPSYVLLASMDYAVHFMEAHPEEIASYRDRLNRFRSKVQGLLHIRLFDGNVQEDACIYGYDNAKIVLLGKKAGMTGEALAEMLASHGQIVEMAGAGYVICMTSVMDTEEAFSELFRVLERIDNQIGNHEKAGCGDFDREQNAHRDEHHKDAIKRSGKDADNCNIQTSAAYPKLRIAQAAGCPGVYRPLDACAGCIAGDYVYAYPPGSPLIVPGEVITETVLSQIRRSMDAKLNMKGIHAGCLRVLEENEEQK